jgi:succinyl-CoA synthetase beta subunit
MVMTSVEASRIGPWTTAGGKDAVSFGRGLRGTARALAALSDYVEFDRAEDEALPTSGPSLGRPSTVASTAGPMVPFADAALLLADHGIRFAPQLLIEHADDIEPSRLGALGDTVVVKLADVAHRSEVGAVRTAVPRHEVAEVARDLLAMAPGIGCPARVVIQPMLGGAEIFVGARNHTDLGSVVVVGLGGVLVELTRAVVGRLLPLAGGDAAGMLEELEGQTAFAGLRGQVPWDRAAVTAAVNGVAALASRAPWLASIDVNPLMCDEHGCTAVDVLMVAIDPVPAGHENVRSMSV